MTDIVERLKDGAVFPMTLGTDVKDVAVLYDPMTPADAIQEIERLRMALEKIASASKSSYIIDMCWSAIRWGT
jgi:hypothetical protein